MATKKPDTPEVRDGAFSPDNTMNIDHLSEMERMAAEERMRLHKAGKDHDSGFPTVPTGTSPTAGKGVEEQEEADTATFTRGSTASSRTDAPLRTEGEPVEPSPRQEQELQQREDAGTTAVPAKKVPAKKAARRE